MSGGNEHGDEDLSHLTGSPGDEDGRHGRWRRARIGD